MIRDIFTNKWIIGAAFVLLIVITGCILYYQQTTQTDKQAAEQADKLLQQWEADKAKTTTTADKEVTNTPAESTTPTAEKPITEITTDKTEPSQAQTDSETQTAETAEVRVSPFGFGPYPEVPADYPYPATWDVPSKYEEHIQRDHELIDRVTIKLWTQGIVSYGGVMGENDLVYPNLKDTVYVAWAYGGPFDDLRYPAVIQGYPSAAAERMDEISREKHERRESFTDADIPSDITVIPYDEGGIDPYTFLGLPKK